MHGQKQHGLSRSAGVAAFLFLLTSNLAPALRLGYGQMVWMAVPYTVVLTIVGYLAQ